MPEGHLTRLDFLQSELEEHTKQGEYIMKLRNQPELPRVLKTPHLASTTLKLSAFALATALATQSMAQDEIEEIQITGTRIQREGMESPTPVTDLGLEELASIDPGRQPLGYSQY